jgi:hypothetical protein
MTKLVECHRKGIFAERFAYIFEEEGGWKEKLFNLPRVKYVHVVI